VKAALAALALLLPGCLAQGPIDEAFCDSDEPCFAAGVGGAGGGVTTGGTDPGFSCKSWEGPCAAILNSCITVFGCTEDDQCIALEQKPKHNNKCEHAQCVDGDWKYTPFTADDIDDGDPCTIDECDPVVGLNHVNTCG
jgi:hypothetical protein